MEGNVYFRKEKQRIRPGLKGSRGQGLWALASLVALLASGLGGEGPSVGAGAIVGN